MINKEKIIRIKSSERILCVVAQHASGPGWGNSPTFVYILNTENNTIRFQCIQPEERSKKLDSLYNIGVEVHLAMLSSINVKVVKEKK